VTADDTPSPTVTNDHTPTSTERPISGDVDKSGYTETQAPLKTQSTNGLPTLYGEFLDSWESEAREIPADAVIYAYTSRNRLYVRYQWYRQQDGTTPWRSTRTDGKKKTMVYYVAAIDSEIAKATIKSNGDKFRKTPILDRQNG
jgi:hypothetical protein